MKGRRPFSLLLLSVLALLLLVALSVNAANSGKPRKPDKKKPVHSTDVKLVKKISLKGPPSWARGGGGKKQVATGTLGEAVSGDRYAVVVGISDYPGDANDLDYCDDDADEMASALTSVYGFANVTLLQDLGATRSEILDAIDSIPTNAGEVVFFFSGHGMNGQADDWDKEKVDEAIVAHDGEEIVPIWDGELESAFSGFATSRIIFVFDTCLAGGMKRDLEAAGRVIAMATTERGYAYESDAWENGEFSYYFVDLGILQGNANIHDYDGDEQTGVSEQVTIEEAFDYAKANCSRDKPTIGDYFEDDLLP